MKIIVATFTYAPNMDGVAEAARLMVENFRNAGHEVVVATGECSSPIANIQEGKVPIRRFAISGAPALLAGFHGEIEAYQQFILDFKPDVIVFHCWSKWPSELALGVLKQLNTKSIMLSHGYAAHQLNIAKLPVGLWKWLRWLPHVLSLPRQLRRYDRVVFLSHQADWGRFFDVLISRLTGSRNIATIPNGIPEPLPAKANSFRLKHGIGSDPFFLCIANYTGRKNQERALRAYAAAFIPCSHLVFIGSELGDYGNRVIELWEKLQAEGAVGRVLFLENVPRGETMEALHDCDIKILAADAETQPIVLLEAMATSKPFISTNTGCVEEMRGGIVVRDADAMAQAMRRLASDPVLRAELGREGRHDYEQHYTLEKTSTQWLDLIDEVAG